MLQLLQIIKEEAKRCNFKKEKLFECFLVKSKHYDMWNVLSPFLLIHSTKYGLCKTKCLWWQIIVFRTNLAEQRESFVLYCITKLFSSGLISWIEEPVFMWIEFWGQTEKGFWILRQSVDRISFKVVPIPNFSRGQNFQIWFDIFNDFGKYSQLIIWS